MDNIFTRSYSRDLRCYSARRMAHLSRDERTYGTYPDRGIHPTRPSIPRPTAKFSNTPYVYTHARMYTYRWLIESKGRGRYKVCRPPRHETHALPLERRRRRTSSCSNVHLVSVDTPTLSADPATRGRRYDDCAGAKEYRAPRRECFIAPRGRLRGDNRVVPSESFSPSSLSPFLPRR